jgi:hypothetical protein
MSGLAGTILWLLVSLVCDQTELDKARNRTWIAPFKSFVFIDVALLSSGEAVESLSSAD